jgi:NAD(P)-dependent dehydrogenase (short-subunit alcohol dehydrogenase family)
MRDLQGKVALITGAASGIGRGLVDAVVAAGMPVVSADVDTEGLAALDEALARAGVRRLTRTLDIRDREAWKGLVAEAERELGPVQLLCNNAGVTATPAPMLEVPGEAWDWVIGVNLTGTFNGAQAVCRRLQALQRPGHIVNTASVQGLFAAAAFAPYNAAKFGIVGLSETLRIELEPLGIGVSVLCPGPTRTRIMANSARIAPHLARPLGAAREGFTSYQTPAEVAAIVIDAVRANRLYILTHPEYAPILEARAAALTAGLIGATAEATENICRVETQVLSMYRAVAVAASAQVEVSTPAGKAATGSATESGGPESSGPVS